MKGDIVWENEGRHLKEVLMDGGNESMRRTSDGKSSRKRQLKMALIRLTHFSSDTKIKTEGKTRV